MDLKNIICKMVAILSQPQYIKPWWMYLRFVFTAVQGVQNVPHHIHIPRPIGNQPGDPRTKIVIDQGVDT